VIIYGKKGEIDSNAKTRTEKKLVNAEETGNVGV